MRASFGRICVVGLLALAGAGAASAEPSTGTAQAVIADLPFLEGGGPSRILLDLAPEGSAKPLRLLLDTGADDSVLTPRMARELGVSVRRTKSTPYRRKTRLGRDLQFWVDTASSDTGSKTGWEYGLLGGRFLADFVVEFDFAARRVRFLDPKKFRVPEETNVPGEAVLRIATPSNRPHAKFGVDGHPVQALFDTGAPTSLMLLASHADRIGLARRPLHGLALWGVLGPFRDLEFAEVGVLSFGSHELRDVPTLVTASNYNQGDSTGAVVGYDLLSQFKVRIDYPRRRIWLGRSGDQPLTFFGMDAPSAQRSGAFLQTEGVDLIAHYVIEDSPAWRLGLRPGDRIATSEGAGTAPDPLAVAAGIEHGGSLQVLRRADGGWVTLTLPAPPESAPSR